MSNQAQLLPDEFNALQPFVEFWAVDSAVKRAHCRDISDEVSRTAFYEAAKEIAPAALAYLDRKPLSQLNEGEQSLMKLLLSFAHVSLAVELQREMEPKHARNRPFMRITKAPADLN